FFEDATIKTAGGRIEIGSISEGIVNLSTIDNGFTFDYSGIEVFRDISLSGRSSIDASGLGGGNIQVTGNNISIAGISGFSAVTLGSTPGKNINIFAADSLEISGIENEDNFVSYISIRIFPNGTADAGNIDIETDSLSIGDRALITSDVLGQGNAGNININASESVTLESQGNTSALFSGVRSGAVGNAGSININSNSLGLSNGAFVSAFTLGQGNAGNITIDTNSLSLTNGSSLNTSTRAEGNAGDISINATNILVDGQGNIDVSTGIFSNVGSEAIGNAGNINITTESLTIANRGVLDTVTAGQGDAGNINVNASNSIAVEGNDADTFGNTSIRAFPSGDMAQGNGGNIELKTGSLTIDNGATLFVSGGTRGKGGNVTIDAAGDVSFANNSNINVTGTEGGSIDINAKSLSIISASNLFNGIPSNSGFSEAQSGDINVNLEEDIVLDGLNNNGLTFISNTSFGIGNPGNININARNITFRNGSNASIFSTSQQDGNIGEVNLNAAGDIVFDGITNQRSGIVNTIPDGASGDIGAINLQAQNLTITNGATISSQVSGIANGGDINIDVANSIKIDGFADISVEDTEVIGSEISSNIARTGVGDAGNISISTQNLELSRNGRISADVSGRGNGGDINIDAEQITIGVQGNPDTSPSFISAETFDSSEGNGGNIIINTGSLFISDGGDIDVGIGGVGNGGNININARDIVSVDGSGILFDSDLSSGIFADALNSIGNAGNIEIETARLSVTNGAFISAEILGSSIGDGGSIIVRASDSIKVSGTGGIEVDILDENAQGNGGNLILETRQLTVEDGAAISAFTLGDGNAGSVIINAIESIELRGFTETGRSGLFASALQGNGDGGNITVSTDQLTISDGAVISVSNFPSLEESTFPPGTGQPGEINVQANSIALSNGGRIIAATQSPTGEGANINLEVAEDITISGDSFISARAINQGSGGNIAIDSRFIIAFPDGNNDILASAEQGQGGNITINAESLFGIQERTPSDLTNDINASSQVSGLDGTISISTPDINPVQGATELPTNVVEPGATTEQACQANREVLAKGGLNIMGKGGIVPDPALPLNSLNVIANSDNTPTSSIPAPIETSKGKIQPARGVKVTKSREIILTAYRTNNSGDRIPEGSANCGQV
ncbi:MAG: hypothetical protein AAFN00_12180, partial [Cyanobacteria bacterium J06558_2]